MKINPIRKILHFFGYDLHKYRYVPDKLLWLSNINIQSVLDVGANIGQSAKEFRKILPNAKIYSFEPILGCYKKLVENFRDDKAFQAFNFALGEKEEELTIHKSDYSPGSSILQMEKESKVLFPHIKNFTDEKIKVKRLDDLDIIGEISKEILVKIDTEGYERNVLNGGIKTIQKAKVVIIENSFVGRFRDQALFPEVYSMLTKIGFNYKGAWTEKLNPETGEILFEDSIFVKA